MTDPEHGPPPVPQAAPRRVRLSPDGYTLAVEYELPDFGYGETRWLAWLVKTDGQLFSLGLLTSDLVADWVDWGQR